MCAPGAAKRENLSGRGLDRGSFGINDAVSASILSWRFLLRVSRDNAATAPGDETIGEGKKRGKNSALASDYERLRELSLRARARTRIDSDRE